jgi:hypothetical protein
MMAFADYIIKSEQDSEDWIPVHLLGKSPVTTQHPGPILTGVGTFTWNRIRGLPVPLAPVFTCVGTLGHPGRSQEFVFRFWAEASGDENQDPDASCGHRQDLGQEGHFSAFTHCSSDSYPRLSGISAYPLLHVRWVLWRNPFKRRNLF